MELENRGGSHKKISHHDRKGMLQCYVLQYTNHLRNSWHTVQPPLSIHSRLLATLKRGFFPQLIGHTSNVWYTYFGYTFQEYDKGYCYTENKPRGLYFSKALFEGLIFGGAYIRRGLSTEGILHFKTDWASLIVGSKFTVFALFHYVFEGNFPSTSPRGAYIWRGDLTEGCLLYCFGGLIFEGA